MKRSQARKIRRAYLSRFSFEIEAVPQNAVHMFNRSIPVPSAICDEALYSIKHTYVTCPCGCGAESELRFGKSPVGSKYFAYMKENRAVFHGGELYVVFDGGSWILKRFWVEGEDIDRDLIPEDALY